MKKAVYVFLFTLLFAGCKFSRSVEKNLISGLTTSGNGLSCDDVYLTVNNERTSRNSFSYGDVVYLVYRDIKGFTEQGKKVFPRMDIVVTGTSGDTLINAPDLYSEYTEGMNYSPLELTADITVGTPIRSGGEYLLNVLVSDRKGTGTLRSKLAFKVEAPENIRAEPVNVTYNEIYLFSEGKGKAVNDGRINFGDNIYIMVEGLNGFKVENELVFPGLSLKGTDSQGNVILDYPDLLSEYSTTGVSVTDFTSRVSSHFTVKGEKFRNPMHCEMVVWDRKSDARLNIQTDVTIE